MSKTLFPIERAQEIVRQCQLDDLEWTYQLDNKSECWAYVMIITDDGEVFYF